MKVSRSLPAVVLVVAAAAAVALWRPWRPADGTRAASSPPAARLEAPAAPLPPAARLRIPVTTSPVEEQALLDPTHTAWEKAGPTAIILNRTPRVYQTEPTTPRPAPRLEACALRAGGKLFLRLRWEDATRNAPQAPPRKTGEAGVPDVIYKRPTSETSTFADAAAVMVPERWTGPGPPSLMMGDAKNPVRLFYWNASRGAEEMSATGRATPQPSGQPFQHRAGYADGYWDLTVALPDQADGTPVAFAVWDGAHNDRDGLKFFSVWYVLTGK
jgi:hypothetical protein